MQHDYIDSQQALESFAKSLQDAEFISFDTEFVSEDTYYPELCLVQVATDHQLAVIDPYRVQDMTPFWQSLAQGNHFTIAHAAREELRFCLRAVDAWPARLFDVQIAAGLVGLEYPAAYGKLIAKLLGVQLVKGETRTDWRRRPLTDRQIEYALQDVIYLKQLRDRIHADLVRLDRVSWLDDEMHSWQTEIEEAEKREKWRRVSGLSGLRERSLVILRELWRWREGVAQATNRPPRRILRDDLLIELSRRAKSDIKQIQAIRGLERSVSKRSLPEISDCIQHALELPKSEWPAPLSRKPSSQATILGQFIATALSSICRSQKLAPGIVGTVQDVRDLVAYRLQPKQWTDAEVPALAQGWRASVVGKTIDQLLDGSMSIRIQDPLADEPLIIEPNSNSPQT